MRMNIDAEVRSCLDVVKVVHDEGDVEGVCEGLHVVGGCRGDGPEHPGHARPEQLTQRLACLEAVVRGVPAATTSSNMAHMSDGAPPLPLCRHEGAGQDGSVVIDRRHGAHEGRLLGAGLRVEQAR